VILLIAAMVMALEETVLAAIVLKEVDHLMVRN
jgi:hypothetical protein